MCIQHSTSKQLKNVFSYDFFFFFFWLFFVCMKDAFLPKNYNLMKLSNSLYVLLDIEVFTRVVIHMKFNEPWASFINFKWNDHECKILFIMWHFRMGFYRLRNEHYFKKKTHRWHGRCQWRHVNEPKCITRVVIWFIWHILIDGKWNA